MADRLAIPAAYGAPAFLACLSEAIGCPGLVDQFCRLCGSKLNTAERTEDDMRRYVEFVHEYIYMRVPGEALNSLRSQALGRSTKEAA